MEASQKHEIMYSMQFAKLSEWHAQFVKLSLNLGYYQRIVQKKGIAVCEALKAWMMLPKSCTATKGHCSCEALSLSLKLRYSKRVLKVLLSMDHQHRSATILCKESDECMTQCPLAWGSRWQSSQVVLPCLQAKCTPNVARLSANQSNNIANCRPSIDQQDDPLHWWRHITTNTIAWKKQRKD